MVPVKKRSPASLRQLGVEALHAALALDAEREIPRGLTLAGANAYFMSLYLARYDARYEDFAIKASLT